MLVKRMALLCVMMIAASLVYAKNNSSCAN